MPALTLSTFAASLTIVYPQEGDTLNAAAYDSNYIFGRVSPAAAALFINDQPVRVYQNGAFLAFLPIEAGPFTYRCLVVHNGVAEEFFRNVTVVKPRPSSNGHPTIDPRSIEPRGDVQFLPGDRLTVAFNGTPGCRAFFRLNHRGTLFPMQEAPLGDVYYPHAAFGDGAARRTPQPGRYLGDYFLQPDDQELSIEVMLIDGSGDTVTAWAPGRRRAAHSMPSPPR